MLCLCWCVLLRLFQRHSIHLYIDLQGRLFVLWSVQSQKEKEVFLLGPDRYPDLLLGKEIFFLFLLKRPVFCLFHICTSQLHYLSPEAAWECPDIDLLFAVYQIHELISSLKRCINCERVSIIISLFILSVKGIGKAIFFAPVNNYFCDLVVWCVVSDHMLLISFLVKTKELLKFSCLIILY